MHKIRKEYNNMLFENSWGQVFLQLSLECKTYQYSTIEATKPQNRPQNRYRDIIPYDHSRIVLKRIPNDYINANLVEVARANRKYILTQGPLASTVSKFWLVVWEQNCCTILMLNKVIEKQETKCHMYWPAEIGDDHALQLNDVKLMVKKIHEEDCDFYTIRKFVLCDLVSGQERFVTQFQYLNWPDFGVPSSPSQFLKFLNCVRRADALNPDLGTTLVHCSAGVGRSGTFCLVDSCLVIIENEGPENLNIQQTLQTMRRDRMGLIQTAEQLRFSYEAILEGTSSWACYQMLQPPTLDFEREDRLLRESFAPPLPPPRLESLISAPGRPLPALPASNSIGSLDISSPTESLSSIEHAPLSPMEFDEPGLSGGVEASTSETPSSVPSILIQRPRNRKTKESIDDSNDSSQDVKKWPKPKRFFGIPITITVGFLIAGIGIYYYTRH